MAKLFEEDVISYIKGNSFSNGMTIKIAEKEKLLSRIEFLTEYSRGKRVLHFGCTDHIPVILEKLKNNTWLHKCIDEVAERQIGLDIDAEAVTFVLENTPFKNIIVSDVINDTVPLSIQGLKWDFLLLGEILEHINNPVEFLSSIHAKYNGIVDEVLLTVPNAFSLLNTYHSFFNNAERINTDHRYWFTPFTLAKILTLSGFTPFKCSYATYYSLKKSKPIRNFILKQIFTFRPCLRGDLIMIAKFNSI